MHMINASTAREKRGVYDDREARDRYYAFVMILLLSIAFVLFLVLVIVLVLLRG